MRLIGACLLKRKNFEDALALGINEQDFTNLAFRRGAITMVQLFAAGIEFDDIAILREIRKTDPAFDDGGLFAQSTIGMPSIVNIPSLVRVVKECTVQRRCIELAEAIRLAAQGGDFEAVETHRAALASLSMVDASTRRRMGVHTLDEMASLAPVKFDYQVYPFCANEILTGLDGIQKLSGKTTLLLAGIKAMLDGKDFLGRPTKKVRVLLVSEQNPGTLNPQLNDAGLISHPDLFIASLPDHALLKREEMAPEIERLCFELKIGWFIGDPFYKIFKFGPKEENDAGTVSAALAPIQSMIGRLRLGGTLTRHENKSGGPIGVSGRGSGAFSADMDQLTELERMNENQYPENVRQLEILGRGEPAKLIIARENGEYIIQHGDVRIGTTAQREVVAKMIADNAQISAREIEKATGIKRWNVPGLATLAGFTRSKKHGWQKDGKNEALFKEPAPD